MLVLALADLRVLLRTADIAAAHERRGAARHRPGLRRRPAGAAPAPRPGAVAPPTCARCSPARPIVASHRGPDCTRVQDAYSLRCAPQVHGAARDTVDARRRGRRPRAGRRPSTTRWCSPTAGSSPTATSTARRSPTCSTSWRSRSPTWRRSAERRTDRFLDVARSHGLPPFLADDPGVDSGHMIAQYTQAGDRLRAQAAGRPGQRRLDPVQRDAGGPRLDGLVGRAQAAPLGRRADAGARDRGAHRRPRRSTCARPLEPAPATGAVVAPAARAGSRAPAPTGTWRPRSRPPSRLVRSGAVARRRRVRRSEQLRMSDVETSDPQACPSAAAARHRR